MDQHSEFGNRLKELRQQKGISQQKLAEEIHISRSAVAKWENGLGLPGEESITLLCNYFEISTEQLLADHDQEQQLVSKNRIITRQKKMIIGLLLVIAVISIVSAKRLWPLMEDIILPLLLGLIIVLLGVFNLRGNIASIHWYNRRKVKKEDQKAYCRVMGLATVIIGAGLMITPPLQLFFTSEIVDFLLLAAVIIGLTMILYAQFKYNRGIF